MARRSRALVPLALAAGSVLLTLSGFEVGVRLAGYRPIYEVYSRPTLFWRADPLLGWSHEPGARGTFVGPRPYPIEFETEVRINAEGLRGPEIEPVPDGGLRVAVLGDSLVAGFEVPYEETFTALLAGRLADELGVPVQTVDAGVRGYGTDQSYLWYRDRGRALAPDLVVFVHSANDPRDNVTLHNMRRPFGKPAFALLPDGSLALRGHPVPDYELCSAWRLDAHYDVVRRDGAVQRAACHAQVLGAERSALLTFLAMRVYRARPDLLARLYRMGDILDAVNPLRADEAGAAEPASPPAPAPDSPAYALTGALLVALARESRANGAEFVLVMRDSERDRLPPGLLAREGITPHQIEVESAVLDARALRFQNDRHLNDLGHRVFARHLAPILAGALRERAAGAAGGGAPSGPS